MQLEFVMGTTLEAPALCVNEGQFGGHGHLRLHLGPRRVGGVVERGGGGRLEGEAAGGRGGRLQGQPGALGGVLLATAGRGPPALPAPLRIVTVTYSKGFTNCSNNLFLPAAEQAGQGVMHLFSLLLLFSKFLIFLHQMPNVGQIPNMTI